LSEIRRPDETPPRRSQTVIRPAALCALCVSSVNSVLNSSPVFFRPPVFLPPGG
jgi:hypothetical protein